MPYTQFEHTSAGLRSFSPQAPASRQPRWLPALGAGLGLMGLALGAAGCSRPAATTDSAKPTYSEQQVADAKKAVCDAYAKGMRTVRSVASRRAETEAEKLPIITVSATGELAAATYFLNVLNANPATPLNIERTLEKLAQQYQEVALIQLANGAPSEYASNGEAIDAAVAELDKSCK